MNKITSESSIEEVMQAANDLLEVIRLKDEYIRVLEEYRDKTSKLLELNNSTQKL